MLFVGPFKLAMQIPSWDRFLQQFSAISCIPRMKIFWFSIFSCVDIKILFFLFPPLLPSHVHIHLRPNARVGKSSLALLLPQSLLVTSRISAEPCLSSNNKITVEFLPNNWACLREWMCIYTGTRGWLTGAKPALCLWHAVGFPNDFPLIADRRWLWQRH